MLHDDAPTMTSKVPLAVTQAPPPTAPFSLLLAVTSHIDTARFVIGIDTRSDWAGLSWILWGFQVQ
jgi:hypothetical protein